MSSWPGLASFPPTRQPQALVELAGRTHETKTTCGLHCFSRELVFVFVLLQIQDVHLSWPDQQGNVSSTAAPLSADLRIFRYAVLRHGGHVGSSRW